MALIQIVEWDKNLDAGNILAWRWADPKRPDASDALGNWTQLVVQEAQEAILFRDGQALDLFGPGRYTLSTDNIPLLRGLMNLPTGGESPFKAWVWFVNKVNVLDVKWGTQTPLLLRDPEYQVPIHARAYGQFGVRVKESRQFLVKLAGSRVQVTRDDLTNAFRGLILSRMGDMIATYISHRKITIFDINAYLKELSDEALDEVRPALEEYGIEPVNFYFGSVNVDENDEGVQELKRMMTERARMNLMGYDYQQKRSFDVLETAAGNSSGGGSMMGAGIGLGTGMGFGGAIGQMAAQMGQYLNPGQTGQPPVPPAQATPPASPTPARFCSNCGAALGAGAKFCSQCGKEVK